MTNPIPHALIAAFERHYDADWNTPSLRNERLAWRAAWAEATKPCLNQIQEPAEFTDQQIDAIAEGMPGGVDGFLKGWGWRQFAREVLSRYAAASGQAAPASVAVPATPWREIGNGMPEWTDDSSIRVIAVTADDDFGGVQLHDVPASDFHSCDPDDPADPDGFGTEVTRACTHWAYRDEIWPRAALAATPAAVAPDSLRAIAIEELAQLGYTFDGDKMMPPEFVGELMHVVQTALCGCREGTCETKSDRACRMKAEIAAAAPVVLPEPAEFQSRVKPDWDEKHPWTEWEWCKPESAADLESTPVLHNWMYEVRKLFTEQQVRALLAGVSAPAAQSVPVALGDEDRVLVPRGLLGAACYAIDKRHDGNQTLAELRRYTTGDLSAAAPTANAPVAIHEDDVAVDKLTTAMKSKLAKQRDKGYGGWDTEECTQQRLSDMLRAHVEKGDPVDVANFCAFLSARGEGIAAPVCKQPKFAVQTGRTMTLYFADDAAALAFYRATQDGITPAMAAQAAHQGGDKL